MHENNKTPKPLKQHSKKCRKCEGRIGTQSGISDDQGRSLTKAPEDRLQIQSIHHRASVTEVCFYVTEQMFANLLTPAATNNHKNFLLFRGVTIKLESFCARSFPSP